MRTPDNTDLEERTEEVEAQAPAGDGGPEQSVAEEQERDPLRVPLGVVQGEWDQSLRRIREVCTMKDASTVVSQRQYAHILIEKTEGLDIVRVEEVVFENLLFSPWARVEHQHTFMISGEWLWKWRKKAAWKSESVGPIMRLAPDSPKRMWTYRMNVIDAG